MVGQELRAEGQFNLLIYTMTINTTARIPVTDEMLETLKDWQTKTGFGMVAIFRHAQIHQLFKATRSLNAPAFNNVLARNTRTVFESDYRAVISAYEALPREAWGKHHGMSRQKLRVPVTEDFKERLEVFFASKTMSRAKILKYSGAPDDLTSTKIGRILKRENTTILKAHAEFLENLISKPQK